MWHRSDRKIHYVGRARLGIIFQQGALALQKLRKGGRQHVRSSMCPSPRSPLGGQAIVAGTVSGVTAQLLWERKMTHGPKTPEGRERRRLSHFKHGYYGMKPRLTRRQARLHVKALRELIAMAERITETRSPPPDGETPA